MKIRTKLRAIERAQDTRRQASPQVFPMMGDGRAASVVTRPLRGGVDSYLGRDSRGRWRQVVITPTREELVEARYRDWLERRDRDGRIAA